MRVRLAAAAFASLLVFAGAALAEPSRPLAPSAATASQQDATAEFFAWTRRLMDVLERANQTMLPFLRNDYDFNENDEAAARAMLRELARQADTARTDLAAARADLAALAAFSHPGATAEMMEMSAILLRESRASVGSLEALLTDISSLSDAVERGDQAEVDRLLVRLDHGVVLLMETQATMLRGRRQLLPRSSSSYHAVSGMASMYDGMAVLMATDEMFDIARLDSAAEALEASVLGQRAAIMLERSTIRPSDPNRDIAFQIMDTRSQFAEVTARARDQIRAAAAEARAGASSELSRMDHIRVLGELEYEYQAISRRQVELAAQLR